METGNLYIVFNGERRIYACGRDNESTEYSKCAELFGNQVGFIISELTLGSTKEYVQITALLCIRTSYIVI